MAQNFFEISQLTNYLQPNDPVEPDENPLPIIHPDIVSDLQAKQKQLLNQQSDCIKNTFFQNLITTLKQQINLCNSQQFAFSQQTVQVTLQDFNANYSPKNLETLDLKVSVNCNFPLQFAGGTSLFYDVIQHQFPLCDDPTKTWFYVNDTRVTYAHPLDSVPYGRLLISGNSLKQPSCVLQDKQLVEGAEELAQAYQHFETVFAKACHALAQLYVSATKHSKRASQILIDEIKAIKAKNPTASELNIQPGDFQTNVQITQEQAIKDQVEDFILQNSALLQNIRFDPRQLKLYSQYEQLKEKNVQFSQMTPEQQFTYVLCETLKLPKSSSQSRNWIVDYDEMFILDRQFNHQSPVSLYTQEPIISRPEDDVIIIRPKFVQQQQYQLFVCKTGRKRTTYDTVSLLAQFLSLVAQIDPLPKRPLTHMLMFNEKLNLKHLFVPMEIAEQCEQEYKTLVYNNKINQQTKLLDNQSNPILFELVVSKLKQISSRDKFAKVKVTEDYNAGECNVCNTRFDSYKHHISSPEHIRNFRAMMLQGENMIMALIHHQNNFELIQAINTQFNAIACTLASEMNCSWHQACYAINEAIKGIGGSYQLDTEDAPRANSPNCKTNSFARWREDVCLRRQGVLESVLTSSSARKSGYKRIKSAAASFAFVALAVEVNRTETIKAYLENLMCDIMLLQDDQKRINKKVSQMNAIERDKYEKQQLENKMNFYNLKVICQTDLLNHCYYKYPEDQIHPESCFVRVKLVDQPKFMFHECGYQKLVEVAMITLLCRACSGLPLSQESLISQDNQYDDVNELNLDDDGYITEIMQRLTDTYPQLDGDMYRRQIQILIEQRQQIYNIKKQLKKDLPLDVFRLDAKNIRSELSQIEIGHVPETDALLRTARVVLQIQQNKKLSYQEMLQQAIQMFTQNQLKSIVKPLKEPVQKFIQNKQVTDLETYMSQNKSKNEEESCEIDYSKNRVKLPYFNIFEPLVQKNNILSEQIKQTPQVAVSKHQLTQAQNISSMIQNCPKQLLQSLLQQTGQKLDLPIPGVLFDQVHDFQNVNVLLQMQTENEYVCNQMHYDDKMQVVNQFNLQEKERSSSCFARTRNLTRKTKNIRSNSVSGRHADLLQDQVSIQLLQTNYEPVFTERQLVGNLATVGSDNVSQQFQYSEKVNQNYDRITQINAADQNNQQEPQHLKINNKIVITAPVMSTNLQELFYKPLLPSLPYDMTFKQQKLFMMNYLPITKQQMNAVYSSLSTAYGGFANYIEITTQFWKASADALLGTSASVSSVTSETPAYGLKTADIASCTLIALSARAKLLEDKALHRKSEIQLQTQSKMVYRAVPPAQLVTQETLNTQLRETQNVDVDVVKNTKINVVGMDALIGGIYGLNGGEQ